MYRFLDTFFFAFHSTFILFILFAWIWKKTRLAHLVVVGSTAVSWFGLGIWFGLGYCPFTDWHWQVRYALGNRDLPSSYIKFLVDSFTGWNDNGTYVDTNTASAFLLVSALSVWLNLRDRTQFVAV